MRESAQKNLLNSILLFLFILLVCSLSLHQIVDNDVFFHVKVGQYILENQSIPAQDVFSHTINGRPWLNNQWFAEIIFYLIYSFLNLNGLILFKTIILCSVFLIMFSTFFKRNEYSWLYFFIAALSVIISSGRFIERPENLTLLFTAIYLYIFIKGRRFLPVIPIIQLFWVNIHGGFVIGLFLTAFFVTGEIIETKIPYFSKLRPKGNSLKLGNLFMLLLAVFFVCFANPYGYKLAAYPLSFMGNKFLQKNVLEWLSPFLYIHMNREDIILSFILLFILCVLSFILNIKKMRPFLLLCFMAFLYLGLLARRNLTLFAIFSSIFFGLNITSIIDRSLTLKRILSKARTTMSICLILILGALIFSIATNRYYNWLGVPQDFGLGVSRTLEPVLASNFIKENDIKGNLFNDYDFGAYFIYSLYPSQRGFIDGRIDTYGEDFYKNDYMAFLSGDINTVKKLSDKYKIDIFVLKMGKEQPLMSNLLKDSKGFKLVYFDEASVIIARDTEQNEELISKYAIDIDRVNDIEKRSLMLGEQKIGSYGFDYLSALLARFTEGRRFPMKEYNLGNFYMDLGAFELARREFEEGIRLSPHYKIMRYCLGNLYFRNGKLDEAIDAYSEALKYDKKDFKVFKVLGDIYLRKNDFIKARDEYEKSIKINPLYDVGVYKILSDIYKFYLNDAGKADEYNARYLQLKHSED